MPELPTCACIGGFPPYDRLTFIYQAAAELSGGTTLPSADCVASVPPLRRFAYIYEAFRVLVGDDSLPSMECVEGETPAEQSARIYQAVALYAADDTLLSYECVRGLPLWEQWIEIYRALYLGAGSPGTLVAPNCVNIANLDVLSRVFCALVDPDFPIELEVYAFLDLAGTVNTLITPVMLNNSMRGAVPGIWALDVCRHNGVVAVPVSLNHTVLRAQAYDLNPSIICNGTTFTAVNRKIENNKGFAPDPTDYEYIKWTPGEAIAQNFMAAFCYETDRSLGADVGGLSIDVINLAFGGNGAVFQVQMDSGSNMSARAHGGQRVPISNNIRYRVQLIADLTGQRAEFWIKNDVTGEFIGSGGEIYVDGVALNAVHTGDYLTNGNGSQGVSGLYFQRGAAARFSSFALPAVTGLGAVQTNIDTVEISFQSGALSWLVEKQTNGGGFTILDANYRSDRGSITDDVVYIDTTVSDGQLVEYRITAKVRQVTSPSNTSGALTIDNGPFAPPTWSDGVAGASTDSDEPNSNFGVRQPVVNGATGLCVKLRGYARNANEDVDVKCAIYDNSLNLMGIGTGTAVVISGEYVEIFLDSAVPVVAAMTYHVAFISANSTGLQWGYLTGQPASSSFQDFITSFAAFPPDPWPAGGPLARLYAFGMGVI